MRLFALETVTILWRPGVVRKTGAQNGMGRGNRGQGEENCDQQNFHKRY
jgi:hypothetical protein